MNWRWAVEGKHGRVMELHGAGIHFLLPTPFSSAVLEPDLEDKIKLLLSELTDTKEKCIILTLFCSNVAFYLGFCDG